VHQLLMNRGCVLSYNPAGLLRSLEDPLSGPVGSLLAFAGRVALNSEDNFSLSQEGQLLRGHCGIFGSLSSTHELKLFRPYGMHGLDGASSQASRLVRPESGTCF
jgi:hypothetical protein